uniref:Uncharacterized protein n=1 Tax=Anguilla anguilla TaxID=7936 RepID=A0A0E9V1K0_ANGAN
MKMLSRHHARELKLITHKCTAHNNG